MNHIHFLAGINGRKGGAGGYIDRLSNEFPISPIRFSASYGMEELAQVKDYDCLSLQYVPHGFQPKGLPVKLPSQIKRALEGRQFHLMLHEIWVGDLPTDPFHHRVMRLIEVWIIRKMVSSLNPLAVHTTNAYYKHRLSQVGVKAELLPLFTNIPVTSKIMRHPPQPGAPWKIVVFGGIRKEWDGTPEWFEALDKELQERDEQAEFSVVGRADPSQIERLRSICSHSQRLLPLRETGSLPANEVSDELMKAQGGIIFTPFHTLGKSGGGCAMRAHGLPLLIPDQGVIGFPVSPDPQSLAGVHKDRVVGHLSKNFPCYDNFNDVSRQFAKSLGIEG